MNAMALNTDYVMRTGAFEPAEVGLKSGTSNMQSKALQAKALERYNAVVVSDPSNE